MKAKWIAVLLVGVGLPACAENWKTVCKGKVLLPTAAIASNAYSAEIVIRCADLREVDYVWTAFAPSSKPSLNLVIHTWAEKDHIHIKAFNNADYAIFPDHLILLYKGIHKTGNGDQ
jgi:hypothetical protein